MLASDVKVVKSEYFKSKFESSYRSDPS